jgi:hypothetical protein
MLDASRSTHPRTHAIAAPIVDDTLPLLTLAAVMAVAISVWMSTTLTALSPLLLR